MIDIFGLGVNVTIGLSTSDKKIDRDILVNHKKVDQQSNEDAEEVRENNEAYYCVPMVVKNFLVRVI